MYEVGLFGGPTLKIDADRLVTFADPGITTPYFTLTKDGKVVFLSTFALAQYVKVE